LLSPIDGIGKHGSNEKIGIAVSKSIDVERRKDADKNGNSTKITGIATSLFTVGNKILSYQLSETALNAMAIISMISWIDDSRTMIDTLMSRSEEGCQFMIGWGADLVCMTDLVNVLVIFQEELEEMANARVPDEFIFCRDVNIHRVESREVRCQLVRKTQLPKWCPEGLTRTQKRRMQRENQEELSREENSSKSKNRQQSDPRGKGTSADVNMVFMLPTELLAPFSDDEEIDFLDQIAQLALDPMTAIFEKPSDDERQHLKALFVKYRVDG